MTRASRGRRSWTEGRPQSPFGASPCAQDTIGRDQRFYQPGRGPNNHYITSWPLTLLAFALRLHELDAQGLWSDEGYTVLYAGLPLGQLLAEIARIDPHPPLYYLAVKLWTGLAGGSDFSLRYLSVAAATLTVPALALLGRRVAGPAGRRWSRPRCWPPTRSRSGTPRRRACTRCSACWPPSRRCGCRCARARPWSAWLLYAASLALAIYCHYYALALAGWHAFLAQRAVLWRPDRLRALGAFALAGAGLPALVAERARARLRRLDAARTLADAAGGLPGRSRSARRSTPSTAGRWPRRPWPPPLLGCLFLLAGGATASFLMLAGWAVGPLLAAWLFGALTGPAASTSGTSRLARRRCWRWPRRGSRGCSVGRTVGWCAQSAAARPRPAGVAPGGGVGRARAPSAPATLAAPGLALLVGALAADARSLAWHFGDPHFSKENVRAAAEFIAARAGPDDLLIGAPGRLWLYDRYGRVAMPTLETRRRLVGRPARIAELSGATAGRRPSGCCRLAPTSSATPSAGSTSAPTAWTAAGSDSRRSSRGSRPPTRPAAAGRPASARPRRRCSRRATAGSALDADAAEPDRPGRARWRRCARRRRSRSRSGWSTRAGGSSPRSIGRSAARSGRWSQRPPDAAADPALGAAGPARPAGRPLRRSAGRLRPGRTAGRRARRRAGRQRVVARRGRAGRARRGPTRPWSSRPARTTARSTGCG